MLNSLIDSYVNLDENNKSKVINIISKVINPVKLYLIVVIFLLLIICVLNYYICRKILSLNLSNN